MNNTIPRKISHIKGKVVKEELRRAHYIIVILSVSLAFLVTVGIFQPLQYDAVFGSIGVILLVLVGLTSLVIALNLRKVK